MATTVTYKGNMIAAVNNNTKTLKTAGTMMEDDVILVDVTEGGTGGVTQDQDGYLILDEEGSGGSVSVAPLSVTQNGVYTAPEGTAYSPVTVSVSGGNTPAVEKQVNFIDYDGTILHSYTATEANALTALPSNPSHTGLTSQGWNWTLQQIKTQLTAIPDGPIWVGQMYVTDDDKTRIYCRFDGTRLSPYLGICPNGTVTVDWGDGSEADTLTGSALNAVQNVQHNYAAAGDYVITLTAASGTTFAFYGTSSTYSYILRKGTSSTLTTTQSDVYRNTIQKIELGSAARIGNYAFYRCYSLSSISMPNSATSIGTYAFLSCYKLFSVILPTDVQSIGNYTFQKCISLSLISLPSSVGTIGERAFYDCNNLSSITLPSGMTSIGIYAFYDCYTLTSIIIPSNITSIGNYTFYCCYCFSSIVIPSGVTSIGQSSFYYCYGMTEYHLKPTSPPTLGNTAAFQSIPSDCVIYVPKSDGHTVLDAYKGSSNWSTYADYMQEEPS